MREIKEEIDRARMNTTKLNKSTSNDSGQPLVLILLCMTLASTATVNYVLEILHIDIDTSIIPIVMLIVSWFTLSWFVYLKEKKDMKKMNKYLMEEER